MRPLIVLAAMLFCFGGLQGDLTAQEDEPETVVVSVDSTNLRFSPSSVTVTEGDTVRFFWSGQALPHNAVERDGLFDSGEPERNVDYSFTFEVGTNGTYEFVCEPHESVGMIGQITVEPAPPSNTTNETNETGLEASGEDTPFPSAVAALFVVAMAAAIRRSQGNG